MPETACLDSTWWPLISQSTLGHHCIELVTLSLSLSLSSSSSTFDLCTSLELVTARTDVHAVPDDDDDDVDDVLVILPMAHISAVASDEPHCAVLRFHFSQSSSYIHPPSRISSAAYPGSIRRHRLQSVRRRIGRSSSMRFIGHASHSTFNVCTPQPLQPAQLWNAKVQNGVPYTAADDASAASLFSV